MLVTRDPFARVELHKERIATQQTCAFCGTRLVSRKATPYLYRFRVETDGGRTFKDDKLYCSKGCRESYQG